MKPTLKIAGFAIYKGFLTRPAQEAMRDALRDVAQSAPFRAPLTPWGKPR